MTPSASGENRMAPRAFTVAFVGPDGAGKTTVCQRLREQLPWPNTYLYMGINQQACNVVLPTTWLWMRWKRFTGQSLAMGGPPPLRPTRPAGGFHPWRTVKSLLRTVNLLAEEWYRQFRCWSAVRNGQIVFMDRHFLLDYYSHDIAPSGGHRTLANRLHGFCLRRFPPPDLILFLDAPAEFLFRRKPEGTVEALARRRQEYLNLQSRFPRWVTLDATQPLDEVVQAAIAAIARHRSPPRPTAAAPPCPTREPVAAAENALP